MRFSLSSAVPALLLSSICHFALGLELRAAVPRKLSDLLFEREICYEDDTLLSFEYWIVDSAPYCKSLLGIVDFTSTISQTSRTTRTTISTSFATVYATATTPAVTVFSTSFIPRVAKRGGPEPTPGPNFYAANPYAYPVYAGDAAESIASSYYSACSCLHLKPETVDVIVLSSTERTLRGIDYETTTIYGATVTSGTTTAILTRQASVPSSSSSTLRSSSPSVSLSSSGPSSLVTASSRLLNSSTIGLISTGATGTSSGSSVGPSTSRLNVSSTAFSTGASSGTLPTSSIRVNSSLASLSPSASLNFTLSSRPTSGFPTISFNYSSSRPTSVFPTISFNSSSSRPTSGFPTISFNSSTSRPTSGFPSISLNSSSIAHPTSGFPSISLNSSSLTRPTSGFPTLSLNSSSLRPTSGFPTPSLNSSSVHPSSGFPITSSNSSLLNPGSTGVRSATTPYNSSTQGSSSLTVSPSATTIYTTSSTTSAAPSATPTLDLDNCPGINGTVITLSDGQQFAVLCNTEYGGLVDIGLHEDTFGSCVAACGIANNGFSATRCRAITYYPDAPPDSNCYFKNLAALSLIHENDSAISAVLISLPALNTTLPLLANAAPTAAPTFTTVTVSI